jgi:hypothetical protein
MKKRRYNGKISQKNQKQANSFHNVTFYEAISEVVPFCNVLQEKGLIFWEANALQGISLLDSRNLGHRVRITDYRRMMSSTIHVRRQILRTQKILPTVDPKIQISFGRNKSKVS